MNFELSNCLRLYAANLALGNIKTLNIPCSCYLVAKPTTCLVCSIKKHFQTMYRDVGMAVPKTTETRCRDGSVQARHVIQ